MRVLINHLIFLIFCTSSFGSFAQEDKVIESTDFTIKISPTKSLTYQGTSTGDNMIETKGYGIKEMMNLLMQPNKIIYTKPIDIKRYDILITSEKRNISEIKERVLQTLCEAFKLKVKTSEISVDAYELITVDVEKLVEQSKKVSLPDGTLFQKNNNSLLVGSSTILNLANILSKESTKIYRFTGYIEKKYNFIININDIEKSLENCGIVIKKVKQKTKIYNAI